MLTGEFKRSIRQRIGVMHLCRKIGMESDIQSGMLVLMAITERSLG